MRYLQITNLALLALGLVLTTVLAVECLIYAIYLDADPIVRRQLPAVLELTVFLGAFSLTALVAYFGHRLHKAWRWPAQLLPFIAATAVVASLAQIRS